MAPSRVATGGNRTSPVRSSTVASAPARMRSAVVHSGVRYTGHWRRPSSRRRPFPSHLSSRPTPPVYPSNPSMTIARVRMVADAVELEPAERPERGDLCTSRPQGVGVPARQGAVAESVAQEIELDPSVAKRGNSREEHDGQTGALSHGARNRRREPMAVVSAPSNPIASMPSAIVLIHPPARQEAPCDRKHRGCYGPGQPPEVPPCRRPSRLQARSMHSAQLAVRNPAQ